MKTYNLIPRDLEIAGKVLRVLVLGEPGRARKEVIIPIEGDISAGAEVKMPKPGHPGRPRIIPSETTEGWLARVNTNTGYRRHADGAVYVPEGSKVECVAKGAFAFGAAGGVGGAVDYLLAIPDGEWIRVKPSSGPAYLLLFAPDRVHKLSYAEAEVLEIDLCGSTPVDPGDLVRL
jgi:hypothetical protein